MVRYYSLMFVVAFGLGWYIMKSIYTREGISLEKRDKLFVYTVVTTLLGARLGHVIFYQSELFHDDPMSILLPISTKPSLHFTGFAGLASHGAAIAIIIVMFYYSRKVVHKPILWILDRIVIPVAGGAIFVRLGNFFNSEIIGKPTTEDSFMAMKFIRGEEYNGPLGERAVMAKTQMNTANEAYNVLAHDPQYTDFFCEFSLSLSSTIV